VFLQTVLAFDEPLPAELVEKMGDAYQFSRSQNVEVKAAYFEVALKNKVASTYQGVAELLGQVGRMKFVRPLFAGLNKVDRSLALATFQKNKDFYHPICKSVVAKLLGVDQDSE
jgi:leukotriene-A4 hydrolase